MLSSAGAIDFQKLTIQRLTVPVIAISSTLTEYMSTVVSLLIAATGGIVASHCI